MRRLLTYIFLVVFSVKAYSSHFIILENNIISDSNEAIVYDAYIHSGPFNYENIVAKTFKHKDFHNKSFEEAYITEKNFLNIVKLPFAPSIYSAHDETYTLYIEKLDFTLDDYLKTRESKFFKNLLVQQIEEIQNTLQEEGIDHGDTHTGNIMIKIVGSIPKVYLIDWANAIYLKHCDYDEYFARVTQTKTDFIDIIEEINEI